LSTDLVSQQLIQQAAVVADERQTKPQIKYVSLE